MDIVHTHSSLVDHAPSSESSIITVREELFICGSLRCTCHDLFCNQDQLESKSNIQRELPNGFSSQNVPSRPKITVLGTVLGFASTQSSVSGCHTARSLTDHSQLYATTRVGLLCLLSSEGWYRVTQEIDKLQDTAFGGMGEMRFRLPVTVLSACVVCALEARRGELATAYVT
jgi:hypothetical protein